MTYIKKTNTEYHIQQYMAQGWESVTIEVTFKEAKIQLKCYRENQPEIPARIKPVRVKKEM